MSVNKVVQQAYVRQLGPTSLEKRPAAEVIQLQVVKLILVMQATNATSERAFSGLCRAKTHLRSTMPQRRLNHMMPLHVHKDKVDKVDPHSIGQSFVTASEHRASVWKILNLDITSLLVVNKVC